MTVTLKELWLYDFSRTQNEFFFCVRVFKFQNQFQDSTALSFSRFDRDNRYFILLQCTADQEQREPACRR